MDGRDDEGVAVEIDHAPDRRRQDAVDEQPSVHRRVQAPVHRHVAESGIELGVLVERIVGKSDAEFGDERVEVCPPLGLHVVVQQVDRDVPLARRRQRDRPGDGEGRRPETVVEGQHDMNAPVRLLVRHDLMPPFAALLARASERASGAMAAGGGLC